MLRQTCDGEAQCRRLFLLPGSQPWETRHELEEALHREAGAVEVHTQDLSRTEGGLGHTAADSSVALAALLTDQRSEWYADLNGKHVLELGCGAGLAGLAIAAAFPRATVELTDCNHAVVDNVRRLAAAQVLSSAVPRHALPESVCLFDRRQD